MLLHCMLTATQSLGFLPHLEAKDGSVLPNLQICRPAGRTCNPFYHIPKFTNPVVYG